MFIPAELVITVLLLIISLLMLVITAMVYKIYFSLKKLINNEINS